jgi:hypothetical protein
MAEKKQPTEAESLVKIGKKLDSIEFMFAMVIIAKVIFVLIDVLNSAG